MKLREDTATASVERRRVNITHVMVKILQQHAMYTDRNDANRRTTNKRRKEVGLWGTDIPDELTRTMQLYNREVAKQKDFAR